MKVPKKHRKNYSKNRFREPFWAPKTLPTPSKIEENRCQKKMQKNNLESLEKKSARVDCGSRSGAFPPSNSLPYNIAFALEHNVQRVQALPVHLLRRRLGLEASGFLLSVFFDFFSKLFLAWFLIRFFFDFGRVLEAQMRPQIEFWPAFWHVFLAPSFKIDFVSIFMLFLTVRTLKIRAPTQCFVDFYSFQVYCKMH